MNKQELVDSVAKKTGLPKTKAQDAVQAIIETIKMSLKKGDEKINIPASKQPKFKAGKELKEAVNK